MENLREWKEAQLMVDYQDFEKALADIVRQAQHYQNLIGEWGIERVVSRIAGHAGASGTIGSEYERLIADANRIKGLANLVEVLRRDDERASS